MPEPLLDITVADGKYRIVQQPHGAVQALRYDEPWLETSWPGVNMVLAMAYELEESRQLLKDVRDFLQHAPLESGVCCCGNPVEGHGFGDGHSPVDDLQYAAANWVERLDKALV